MTAAERIAQLEAALRRAEVPHALSCLDANTGRSPFECVCFADKHNANIDAVLAQSEVEVERHVGVGVAVFVFNDKHQFLVMKRRGSHGAGTWGLPGGHIEFGEEIARAACREVKEETDLEIVEGSFGISVVGLSEATFPEEQKHYITVVCAACAVVAEEARIVELNKCDEIRWVTKQTLPEPLFAPLGNYLAKHEVPEL